MMTRVAHVDSLAVCALLIVLAGCSTTTAPDAVIMNGSWGGDHAVLDVTTTGASIEFDCAHGTLPVPLTLNRGTFDVTGDYVQEHGGPIRSDETVDRQPARYTGTVSGNTMTLLVRLTATGQDLGTYTLTRGRSGRVFKCL
jgi:hypothetical protein